MRLITCLSIVLLFVVGSVASAAPTVHVLTEGYVQPIEGREFVPGKTSDGARKVASTIVLVKADDATIVVDPGMVATRDLITEGLAKHEVTLADVTHVFISHHHPDHTVNIGMFPNAKLVDFGGVVENDVWSDHPDRWTVTPGVWVLRTPGHTRQDASLIVETAEGVYAMTHVWWTDEMQPVIDPLAEDQKALEASRLLILETADWIIPGHGKRFANPGRRR